MPAKRTNITMPESLYELAQEVMSDQHYESFSEYVAELIRRDAIHAKRPPQNRVTDEGNGGYGPPKKSRCAIKPLRVPTAFYVIQRKGKTPAD